MKEKAPKAMKFAVNDTARKARSRLWKKAQETYAVKQTGINRDMKIKFATVSTLTAVIRSRGTKIPLYRFAYRKGTLGSGVYYNPTLHRRQRGKGGISAAGKKLKSSSFKPATTAKLKWFVASMGSGHVGLFKRKSEEGREISEIMGASVPEMIGDERRVYGIVEPHIESDLREAVNRHVARALRGDF